MTGLRGEAAIVGFVELPPERKPTRPSMFTIEQYARLAKAALDDAGLDGSSIDGLVTHGIAESDMFAPATLSEYLGIPINYGEVVDLGGATSAGMIWRAAAAIELGLCEAVGADDRRRLQETKVEDVEGRVAAMARTSAGLG